MSGNLQYVGDTLQKLYHPIVPIDLSFFINSIYNADALFLVAMLTDWSQMIKKAFETQKLSFLLIMRLEFQNVFQACMHIRENLDSSPFFLFLPVSFFLVLLFVCLHLGKFSPKYQGK